MIFTIKIYRIIEHAVIIFAAIFSLIMMLFASQWDLDISYLWTILPYGTFFLISYIFNNRKLSNIVPIATCVTSILIFLFSLIVYIDGILIHTSSTSALLFLFVPIYILFGGPLTLGIIFWLLKLFNRLRKRENITDINN